MDGAAALHYELMVLNDARLIETNPVPVKTALALMGKISGELRAPLAQLSEDHVEQLKTVLKRYALI
jgi:4-hydroxy-tetrahydrodipicolinate synthase